MFLIKQGVSTISNIAEKTQNTVLNYLSGDVGALQDVVATLNKLSEESNKIGKLTQIKHLSGYNYLQDIMMAKYPQLVFGPNPEKPILSPEEELELDQIAADFNFYIRLAAGAYGDLINYVLSGKQVTKLLDPNDQTDEFLKLSRLDRKQLVYYNWEATAYNPAHCIVVLKERKEVVFVIRGSFQTGDFLTDLIATYLNFSVMEDENGNRYIKINSNDQEIKDCVTNLEDSKLFSPEKKNVKKDKEVFNGIAHSGIFMAGIEIYKKTRNKLEEIFQKLPKDYNLKITGHSLGGGMTSIMTFLFLVHPLKYFGKSDLKNRVVGYSYGAPPVLSKSVGPLLEGHLYNLVNGFDLVPRLNFGTLKDLDHVIMEFHEREKTDDILKKELIFFKYEKKDYEYNETEKEHLKHFLEIYLHIKEKVLVSEKLYHLGRTFVQFKQESTDPKKKDFFYTFKEVKNDDHLSDLIMCYNMVNYHFPNLYHEGLSNEIKFIP